MTHIEQLRALSTEVGKCTPRSLYVPSTGFACRVTPNGSMTITGCQGHEIELTFTYEETLALLSWLEAYYR